MRERASTSFLQRKLQIGYNRAARIIDMMEENGVVSKANHVGKKRNLKMKNFIHNIFFFILQNNLAASNKENIINNLKKIQNISFNFIQTIGGKDEKGKCTIQYPKKIYCEYEKRKNKILVSRWIKV